MAQIDDVDGIHEEIDMMRIEGIIVSRTLFVNELET